MRFQALFFSNFKKFFLVACKPLFIYTCWCLLYTYITYASCMALNHALVKKHHLCFEMKYMKCTTVCLYVRLISALYLYSSLWVWLCHLHFSLSGSCNKLWEKLHEDACNLFGKKGFFRIIHDLLSFGTFLWRHNVHIDIFFYFQLHFAFYIFLPNGISFSRNVLLCALQ